MKKSRLLALVLSLVFTLSICSSAFAGVVDINDSVNKGASNVIKLTSDDIQIETVKLENIDENPFLKTPVKNGFETYLKTDESGVQPIGLINTVLIGFMDADHESITVGVYNGCDEVIKTSKLKVKVNGENHLYEYEIYQTQWAPGMSKVTIKCDQQSVEEKLKVSGKVMENNAFQVLPDGTATRALGSNTLKQWSRGTFPTVEESVNYHFREHKKDRYLQVDNIKTIQDYCFAADRFLNFIKGLSINGDPNGSGFKFYVGGKYIICGGTSTSPNYPIYSYGGR